MAVIFDFQHAQTKNCIPSSLFMLLDPDNMGVAVGIVLLSCVYAEICATKFSKPPSWISNFAYLLAAYYNCCNTSGGVSAHEYSGVAVRISFLASVEQEIYYAFKFLTVFIYNFRFWTAILANWWVVNFLWPYHLVAVPYLGKVSKAFPLTSSGYEIAAERMAWG